MPRATARRTSASCSRSRSTTATASRSGSATRTTSTRRGAVMKTATVLLVIALAAPAFAQAQQGGAGRGLSAPAKPTPRAADGHPDLSGVWIAGNRGIRPAGENASIKVVLPLEGVDQDKDNVFAALDRISVTERAKDQNKPPYKPELLAKVKDFEGRQS